MKKILLGSAAFAAMAAFASAALAADLPSRRAPPVYIPPPAPAFTWSGFYAGANAGAGFNDYTSYGIAGVNNANVATGARPAYLLTNASGFIGGAQIGYNFQLNQGFVGNALSGFGSVLTPVTGLFGLGASSGPVAGIEADADYMKSKNGAAFFGNAGGLTTATSDVHFLGTVRGRLGYGFGNVLLYGTGGFAYANVKDNLTLFNAAGANVGFGGVNKFQTGYTYGGGIEYAIPTASFLNVFKSSAVTLKAEFLHYVVGADTATLVSTAGAANIYTVRALNYGNVARAGINYKFDFAPTPVPVVARY